MAVSFHSSNYPAHKLGFRNKNGSYCATKRIPALAIPPSSIESSNLLDSQSGLNTASTDSGSGGYLLNQENAIGIIGGVSPNSTLNFLKQLVNWSTKDSENCPPFILCSNPALRKELLLYERNSFSSNVRKNGSLQINHAPIVENLRQKRLFLENSGARCIVMPCHISHSWYDEVSSGCSVCFLHVGECLARELKEAKLKPIEAGSTLQIGLLATDVTLTAGVYHQKLKNQGFEVVLPDKATMEHTVIPAVEALNRKDMEGAQNLLRIALQVLLVRAVNTIILASDDMWELLPRNDPLLRKCVNPMDALVRSTIKWAQSAQQAI
ncbi:Aspartate racemase [Bertholletia excelsa]